MRIEGENKIMKIFFKSATQLYLERKQEGISKLRDITILAIFKETGGLL